MENKFVSIAQELEAILAPVSITPDLHTVIKEHMASAGRGLGSTKVQSSIWPVLPLTVSQAICGKWKHAVPAAAALQLLMAAGDIFDDIEDADDPDSLPSRYGLALAANAATVLIFLAEKTLAKIEEGTNGDRSICHPGVDLNSFFVSSCIGQHLDLTVGTTLTITEAVYLNIIELKSASQIECACHIGAVLATPNQNLINICDEFGRNLGMAAQISNDILGVTQGKDITKKKLTLPALFAINHSEGELKQLIVNAFCERTDSAVDTAKIRELLFQSGAIHYSVLTMENYRQKAKDALAEAARFGMSIQILMELLG